MTAPKNINTPESCSPLLKPASSPSQSLSQSQLARGFHDAVKAPEDRKIGLELEFFLVNPKTFHLVNYFEPHGGKAVLRELHRRYSWQLIKEGEEIVGLSRGGAKVTLEPSGTIEFDSIPSLSLPSIEEQIYEFCKELSTVATDFERDVLTVGILPFDSEDDIPLVPKSRYDVMWNYMPLVGKRGREMMKLTAAIQISIDYTSEEDAREVFRLATCLTPYFLALSANSSFSHGRHSGRATERGDIWLNTDPARTELPAKAYLEGLSFDEYVDWALDVPLYFIERDTQKHVLHEFTFRQLLKGESPFIATEEDWENHLSTLFPPVRYRKYVEIRHFDMNPPQHQLGFLALIKGLFYSDRTKLKQFLQAHDQPRVAEVLRDVIQNGTTNIKPQLLNLLSIAQYGLDTSEVHFLDPLCAKIENNSTRSLEVEDYLQSMLLSHQIKPQSQEK